MKTLAKVLVLTLSSITAPSYYAAPFSHTPAAELETATVIGKVFHDKNRNGFQDSDEEEIAGVRLVTVTGLSITTDGYGRFHLPRIAGSQGWSQNFIVKLDKTSLPQGAKLTTENPRVIHSSTALNKINFGVFY